MNKGGFRLKISLKDALERVLSFAKVFSEETVNFNDALGRVVSQDVISDIYNPPFDRAMMDGYAVHAEDTFKASESNPINLKISGSIVIGDKGVSSRLEKGEAMRIMTGAPSPTDADAVVKVEVTEEREGDVYIYEPINPGKNISKRGEDIKKGDKILSLGRVLKPHDAGVLAATGNLNLQVRRQPLVKVISTGSELLKPGEKLQPGGIYDINSFTITNLTTRVGCLPKNYGIIKDDESELEAMLTSNDWDVFIVSGATSVGQKDFVPDVVGQLGKIVFHGVNIRPGSPVGFGIVNDKPVFMLPGFPVASITAFELLVTPFLQKMLGTEITSTYQTIDGILERAVPSHLGRVDFVRVRIIKKEDTISVLPVSSKGAGLITTLSGSDGFILVEENKEGLESGETVEVYLF